MESHQIIIGDVIEGLRTLPTGSVHCCVTSPPYYGLRDYGMDGQIGLEKTPEEFIAKLVSVFEEVRRVLRHDGTCWVNMGDSYAAQRGGTHQPAETLAGGVGGFCDDGSTVNRGRSDGYNPTRNASAIGVKHKDLLGIPWRLALALRSAGWYLRQDIIWSKPNPMPESVTDRCTKSHEYLFLLSNSARYFYDAEAIKESAKPESVKRYEYGYEGLGLTQHIGSPTETRNGRTASGESLMHLSGRNRRSVWTIATQSTPEAHFATFPEALVVPCILAGTSEKGVCAACGAPWVRIIERTAMVLDRSERTHERGRTRSSGTMVEPPTSKTTGWQPSCDCNAAIVPAVVLDPFLGSGTTLAVAKKLGRNGVGCELNPEYAEIARKKIARARIGDVEKPVKPAKGQRALFQEAE